MGSVPPAPALPVPVPPARRLGVVGALLAVTGTLGACSAAVSVPAAPYATDPLCAEVVLALPRSLADESKMRTTSQATAAWGTADEAIVLRCGVEPPPPTTEGCVTAEDGITSVDWIAVPGTEDETGAAPWTFTTYGRDPAVEVRVPASITGTRSTSFLLELGSAIERVPATRTCL